jgi:hypothetical protein
MTAAPAARGPAESGRPLSNANEKQNARQRSGPDVYST